MRIIDIHCHILPGMDDGASDIRESREMLRLAYEQGICTVVATPHYSSQFRNDRPDLIIRKCRELEEWARKELDKEFRIYPGQEIFSAYGIVEKIGEGKLLTMAGNIYILIEFLPSTAYSSIYQTLRELAMSPYRPILAHIERYRELRKNERVEELIHMGALMQMNFGSIGGKWYDETARWCRKMLLEGNIHFLGTDMHNTRGRAPRTGPAMQWMTKNLDEEYLEDICWRNAEKFILNVDHR